MTMPPFSQDPEDSRPHFARLAELAAEHGLTRLSMGTSQDWRVAIEEGATIVRLGTALYRVNPALAGHNSVKESAHLGRNTRLTMALRDTWHRALVYFGLAEDHDYGPEYEEDFEPETGSEEAFEGRRERDGHGASSADRAPLPSRRDRRHLRRR